MPRRSRYEVVKKIDVFSWRAAGYIRLSSEDKNKDRENMESYSVSNQKELISLYLKEYGDIKFEDFYIDDGYTGTNFDRPDFQRLLEDIKNKKINCIIIKDLSRLGRNYIEVGNYLDNIFPLYNIRVISINENIDNTENPSKFQDTVIGLKNIINDEYARDISKKTRGALNAKKKNGEFCGGLAPYGYIKDPTNVNHLIIDDEAANVVKRIYKMYLDGIGQFTIAKTLNEEGILSPSEYRRKRINEKRKNKIVYELKSYWRTNTIRRILKSEAYCGDCIQGKETTISYKDKTRVSVPKDKWIIIRNTHEAIIDRETFKDVQNKFKKRNVVDNTPKNISMYRYILKCADCKRRMLNKESTTTSGTYKSWYCSTYIGCSHDLCTKHKIKSDVLDNTVFETIKLQINLILNVEKVMKELISAKKKEQLQNKMEKKKNHFKKELDKQKQLKKKLYEDWKLEVINDNDFLELRKEYEITILELTEKINNIEKKQLEDKKIENYKWIDEFKKYQNIQKLDSEVISNLIKKIYIHEDNKVTIVFKYEDEYKNTLNYIKERSVGNV